MRNRIPLLPATACLRARLGKCNRIPSRDIPSRDRKGAVAAYFRHGLLVLLAAVAVWAGPPMTKLTVEVKSIDGKPVDRASVVVKFVEGKAMKVVKKHATFEMRTDQEGVAKIPEIPQGKIRIQVIAKNYQTFGEVFDVDESEKTIEIKLNPPQAQFSAHQ